MRSSVGLWNGRGSRPTNFATMPFNICGETSCEEESISTTTLERPKEEHTLKAEEHRGNLRTHPMQSESKMGNAGPTPMIWQMDNESMRSEYLLDGDVKSVIVLEPDFIRVCLQWCFRSVEGMQFHACTPSTTVGLDAQHSKEHVCLPPEGGGGGVTCHLLAVVSLRTLW